MMNPGKSLQLFVLKTLLLQSLLFVVAPLRKQVSGEVHLDMVWFLYINSDWASNIAVGLIQATMRGAVHSGQHSEVLKLWAPFLLLHIGGVDSISALASSDNELWYRFAIQLATMAYGFGSAYYRSFLESRLRLPVLLMFVAGFTKYIERLLSFYHARFSSVRESLLENKKKAKSRHESSSSSSSSSSLDLDCIDASKLNGARSVRDASHLFQSFKGLFVDLPTSSEDRDKSKQYFLLRSSRDAFRVAKIELNFAYDLFYSKRPVLRRWSGRILGLVSIVCQVASLVLWFRMDKRDFTMFDVRGTYALLWGALARDSLSLLTMACSDWTLARVVGSAADDSNLINTVLRWRPVFRLWSQCVYQLNFIDCCFYDGSKDTLLPRLCGLHYVMNTARPAPMQFITHDLTQLLFNELQKRATLEHSTTVMSRGQWTLENLSPGGVELPGLSRIYVDGKTFDESLLIWHIATTLCYHVAEQESLQGSESEKQCHELSKLLSDYMLYLLLESPEMTMDVATMGDMRYEETRNKARAFFKSVQFRDANQRNVRPGGSAVLEKVADPNLTHEDGENSVLFASCRLASRLKELESNQVIKMWELLAKVWAEMLIYGASRCSPKAHADQLANGGGLITLVWLLMHHLGLRKG